MPPQIAHCSLIFKPHPFWDSRNFAVSRAPSRSHPAPCCVIVNPQTHQSCGSFPCRILTTFKFRDSYCFAVRILSFFPSLLDPSNNMDFNIRRQHLPAWKKKFHKRDWRTFLVLSPSVVKERFYGSGGLKYLPTVIEAIVVVRKDPLPPSFPWIAVESTIDG